MEPVGGWAPSSPASQMHSRGGWTRGEDTVAVRLVQGSVPINVTARRGRRCHRRWGRQGGGQRREEYPSPPFPHKPAAPPAHPASPSPGVLALSPLRPPAGASRLHPQGCTSVESPLPALGPGKDASTLPHLETGVTLVDTGELMCPGEAPGLLGWGGQAFLARCSLMGTSRGRGTVPGSSGQCKEQAPMQRELGHHHVPQTVLSAASTLWPAALDGRQQGAAQEQDGAPLPGAQLAGRAAMSPGCWRPCRGLCAPNPKGPEPCPRKPPLQQGPGDTW